MKASILTIEKLEKISEEIRAKFEPVLQRNPESSFELAGFRIELNKAMPEHIVAILSPERQWLGFINTKENTAHILTEEGRRLCKNWTMPPLTRR